MAKQTVLELTQSILSSLDSDEVNSISDTTESLQVASIISAKYYDILARAKLPEQEQLLQLTASGDNTKPTLMTIPSGVSRIDWIQYFDNDDDVDVPPGYKYVQILPISALLDMINSFNPDDDNVGSFTFTEGSNSFTFYYKDDAQPRFCTIIENQYVIFDSYDSDIDTTLQASKTLLMGQKVTPFVLTDAHIPDLDDNQFPLLLSEAKALAFYEMKQVMHPKAEQEIKRQWSTISKNKDEARRPTCFDALPNFGRKGRSSDYSNRWMREKR